MIHSLIEMIARKHKIDFLTIESSFRYRDVLLKAPYMTEAFIEEMEHRRPIAAYMRYEYPRGFVHWLAWKLRARK